MVRKVTGTLLKVNSLLYSFHHYSFTLMPPNVIFKTFLSQAASRLAVPSFNAKHSAPCGKAVSITYSECVFVSLVIQQARHMSRIILSSVACPALHYPSTLSHKRHNFRQKKKVIKYKMCVLSFSTTFVTNISHSRNNSAQYYHKCT